MGKLEQNITGRKIQFRNRRKRTKEFGKKEKTSERENKSEKGIDDNNEQGLKRP